MVGEPHQLRHVHRRRLRNTALGQRGQGQLGAARLVVRRTWAINDVMVPQGCLGEIALHPRCGGLVEAHQAIPKMIEPVITPVRLLPASKHRVEPRCDIAVAAQPNPEVSEALPQVGVAHPARNQCAIGRRVNGHPARPARSGSATARAVRLRRSDARRS